MKGAGRPPWWMVQGATAPPGPADSGGRNRPDQVVAFRRNQWSLCAGISGRFQPACSTDFRIDGNDFVVSLGHTPLARPQEIVMEYLASQDEITNAIGRGLTGITSENTMKDVFYSLRRANQIEMVPGKRGSKSAWRKAATP